MVFQKFKRTSIYQKVSGYNDLAQELRHLRSEYESVQCEKIKLREKLSEETKLLKVLSKIFKAAIEHKK